MGKAARRRKADHEAEASGTKDRSARRAEQIPFVGRPFEGLPGETDWVAMREILPAATATVTLTAGDANREVTIATVLPMAWPGLHRADGTLFVGTQTGSASGDASRDLAAALLAVVELDEGTPLAQGPQPTTATPRLQDVIDTTADFTVMVHDGFDFWVGDTELDGDAKESMDRANESVIPTVAMSATPSAYWCRIGERTHIRLVLPQEEDAATDALARLLAHGDAGLGGTTRLLGAFRASGLLVPVWDLDPELGAEDYEDQLGAFSTRYAAAVEASADLTAEERRARSGLLSRQVTLR